MSHLSFHEFLTPANPYEISGDEGYEKGQIGYLLTHQNDFESAGLVLLGCNEWRGTATRQKLHSANAIRQQLYKLYHWHHDIQIADLGNIIIGESLTDSYAALKLVVKELLQLGKKIVIIGGSHDNTIALYQAFAERQQIIEATVVDAMIDIHHQHPEYSQRFLIDMLTGEPNFVRHFNLIGFQSYFANPNMLETIDKLRFDCYRVGRVQERMDEVEPAIRSSELFSVDLNALAYAYAPGAAISPNGFTGQEMCKLMQYAGMSQATAVAGIFNFCKKDTNQITALQVAQMIWYFMDGMQKQLHEAPIHDLSGYNEYHTLTAEVDTLFLQSKNTGRWWMKMPNQTIIPCSHTDYLQASHNDLPERWLRTQERL